MLEFNDGGPPMPYSTHNERFTELGFDIHSPENLLYKNTTQFGLTNVFLFKIVMPYFIVFAIDLYKF